MTAVIWTAVAAIVFAAGWLFVGPVRAADGLPWGATCAMVRTKVAKHGKTVALAYAERNYTPSQCARR